ncbi:MAG: DHH family phosphoesterase [Actinomycetota bacterium]|nr:DHH family phosphoesterase [Actinomycetota bacterium]
MDIQNLYSQVSEVIDNNKDFIIITHANSDGDSLGSQEALYQLLLLLKKNVVSVCESELPYQYGFLPDYNEIKSDLEWIEGKNKDYVCFCLDCADEYRMNIDFKKIKESSKLIINIDHHHNNTNFGNINIVDTQKSATAEILYDLISTFYKNLMNKDIALGIYIGILTDTGNFQYSNTNYRVHEVVSELLKFDLDLGKIHKSIYESEPLERFKLMQLVLQRIGYVESLGLIYSYVLNRDFQKLNLPLSAQDGLINLLRSAEKVRVAALIKQIEKGKFKISIRTSDNNINLFDVASRFGGGGHKKAAGYADKGSLRTVINNLKKAVERGIEDEK